MAKSYKKKQDNFMRNIFIGFGVIFIILMAVFVYMRITEPKYTDFEQVGNYAVADNMPEDQYAVYFYSETCPSCESIKNGMLKFANNNDLGLKFYLMDAGQTYGDRLNEIPGLTSTPTLIIYQNRQMVDFIVGSDNITEFMNEVNAGTYDELD